MSFEKESRYGVIKIDDKKVKLYNSQTSYSIINIGYEIKDVRWVGQELIVYLTNGKVRRYKTQTSYTTI